MFKGTVGLTTLLGTFIFYVLDTPTPFLLSLSDIDNVGVYLNNTRDLLVKYTSLIAPNSLLSIIVLVIRKYVYP